MMIFLIGGWIGLSMIIGFGWAGSSLQHTTYKNSEDRKRYQKMFHWCIVGMMVGISVVIFSTIVMPMLLI